jgi:hypothetical protein
MTRTTPLVNPFSLALNHDYSLSITFGPVAVAILIVLALVVAVTR